MYAKGLREQKKPEVRHILCDRLKLLAYFLAGGLEAFHLIKTINYESNFFICAAVAQRLSKCLP